MEFNSCFFLHMWTFQLSIVMYVCVNITIHDVASRVCSLNSV